MSSCGSRGSMPAKSSSPSLLRPATDADAEAVLALLDAADLEAEFVAAEFRVAVEGDVVLACARLKPLPDGTHELASVAVRADLRGRGIGERLVRDVLAAAPGTVHALALAPGFFQRVGFEPVREVPAPLRPKASSVCASRGFTSMTWSRPARR